MARVEVDAGYLKGVRKRLDALVKDVEQHDYDPRTERIIVFSDHHKGAGDGADDFRSCQYAYRAALAFYFERGYRLFLLGDAEELWEVPNPKEIFDCYREIYGLERKFADDGRLERFWGNHDDLWSNRGKLKKILRPKIGSAPMREGFRLTVRRDGREDATIFFVHGHQGTPESDRWSWAARLPVRYIWPVIQRLQSMSATRPAHDAKLRGKHDSAMFEWARERRNRVLIAGHTHKPVFGKCAPDPPVTRPIPELEAELAKARASHDVQAASAAAAELEFARALLQRPDVAVTAVPPCYFNTGCCSFPDGDITGIELADEEIRLVRFPANLRDLDPEANGTFDPERRVLEREKLSDVLDSVADPPADAGLRVSPILPAQ